jgi:hypothetical protein
MAGLGSEISGFCVIAALIIAFDCMFMFSLFLPVLTLHMEMKRSRGEESATQGKPSTLLYPKLKLILILGFLAMHTLNNASSSGSNEGISSAAGTRAVFSLLRDTGVKYDVIVDAPAPIVYRPLWFETDELEETVPFFEAVLQVLPVDAGNQVILGLVALLIGAIFLFSGEGTEVEKSVIVRNDSCMNIDSGVRKEKEVTIEDSEVDDSVEAALKKFGPAYITDEQFVSLVESGKLSSYALEKTVGDSTRAVSIRRMIIGMLADFIDV